MSEGFEIIVSVKFECGSKYSNWFMYFLVTNLQWFIKIITFRKSLAFEKRIMDILPIPTHQLFMILLQSKAFSNERIQGKQK